MAVDCGRTNCSPKRSGCVSQVKNRCVIGPVRVSRLTSGSIADRWVANSIEESTMKKLIGLLCCFMLAASPLGFAQGKVKDAGKKAAPAAEKSKKPPTEKQKAQQ